MKNNKILKKKTGMLLFVLALIIFMPLITGAQKTYAKSTELPENATQASQVKAMGMSDEQKTRTDPSGREVDKSKNNPLGGNKVTLNRTLQLAISGIADLGDHKFGDVYNNPLANGYSGLRQYPTEGNKYSTKKWFDQSKSMIGADVTGSGKQAVVVSYLLPLPNGRRQLYVAINNYNSIPSGEQYFYVAEVDNPGDDVRVSHIKSAAADLDKDGVDEIGIVVNKTLFICDPNANNFLVSQTTFDGNSSIINMSTDNNKSAMDIGAGDSDGDGYNELLVTTGSSNGGYIPKLLIYDGLDANNPTTAIQLKTNTITYLSASADVGDILGDGTMKLVLGGKTSSSKAAVSYIKYDAKKLQYDSELTDAQTWQLNEDFSKFVSPLLGLKCASLDVLKTSNTEYVVLGGFIYKYTDNVFKKQNLDSVNKYGQDNEYNPNSISDSNGNMINLRFNNKKDQVFINNIIVGNFDGNDAGKEQIMMVNYYYHGGGDDIVYISWCGIDKNGKLNSNLQSVWCRKNETRYFYYPEICGVDIYNSGVKLEYLESKTMYTFSNPSVIAVLGATPYFDELSSVYGGLGNVGTTYGNDIKSGSSKSTGVSAHVGVSFGYTQELGILGINIGEVSLSTHIENTFTNTWTSSKSITKSIKYTTYTEDSVVVMVVPYDIYYYKATDAYGKTQEISINVPYEPITKIMPVKDYNEVAETINKDSSTIDKVPIIDTEVLQHKIGDPRTYFEDRDGLVNSSSHIEDVYVSSFSQGSGNSSSEQSISTEEMESKSFDYSLDVDVDFNMRLFCVTAGANAGAGVSTGVTSETSNATFCSGSVASIPSEYKKYDFDWALTTYQYKAGTGDKSSKFLVVSYLVRPSGGGFPARVPNNLRLLADTTKVNTNTLQWDKTEGAAGYILTRSTEADRNYKEIARLNTGDFATGTYTYADNDLKYGTTYYYKVAAYATKEGMPTEALQVMGLKVTKLSVKQQPKLFYTEEDLLDLSSLLVTLVYSNGASDDVSFRDFTNTNLTISKENGTELRTSDTGTYITITYLPEKLTAQTGKLTVNAEAFYDFTVDVAFKVGLKEKATKLEANQMLTAQVTVHNNLSIDNQVIVIVALYDSKGTMVNMSYKTLYLASGASNTIQGGFQLPDNVDHHIAKVFVWEGSDIKSTQQTPVSNVVQIPYF